MLRTFMHNSRACCDARRLSDMQSPQFLPKNQPYAVAYNSFLNVVIVVI